MRYVPAAQFVLVQMEQAVLEVTEHPLLLYSPDPQVAQVEHE